MGFPPVEIIDKKTSHHPDATSPAAELRGHDDDDPYCRGSQKTNQSGDRQVVLFPGDVPAELERAVHIRSLYPQIQD